MRVGIVCPYAWDVPGGVQTHIRDLAAALRRRGLEVAVLAPAEDESELPPWVTSAGRPIPVPYNGSVARLNLGVRSTRRVRRWIRDGDFDVLHIHEPVSPSVSVIACWAATGPMVATWHASVERSRALNATFYLAQTAMEKISGRIAVSEAARRTLVDHLGGDAVLIPNGVACADFADAAPLPGWGRGQGAVLFLGRVDEPRKGLPTLLAALPQLLERRPQTRLLIAGPGDISTATGGMSPQVRSRIVQLGLVSEQEKVAALHSVDVYVAPNTGGESFGIVLLEAMASGTAVLASDLEAFRRVLDDGTAGATFRRNDADDLAAQLGSLLDDDDRRSGLVAAGHRRAADFDWDRISGDVIDVYESVTVSGDKVREDLRGQLGGRLQVGRGRGASRP
ncbi:MAG: glycosyltransferase family 1 protein [Actinomycetota bacterium]|nr:MAG: glycosyltransferase family 1 protein [Actinomycetota bacterium]